jgi:hypothetical protein
MNFTYPEPEPRQKTSAKSCRSTGSGSATLIITECEVTCIPSTCSWTRAGIAAIIISGAVLPVSHRVGVDTGLVQGVDHCKITELLKYTGTGSVYVSPKFFKTLF